MEFYEPFAALFQAAPLGIVVVDADGTMVRANPALAQMFGYDADQLDGQPVELLIPEALRMAHRGYRAAFQQAPRTRPMGQGRDLQGRRRNGTVFPIEVSLTQVALGGFPVAAAFVADVSARHDDEAARARLAAIIDSTDDAILGFTPDDRIFAWNAAAERLYGYSAAEIIGQPRALIVPDDRREELQQINARVAGDQAVVHVETVRRHKSGRLLDIAVTFSPIVDASGAVIGFSAIDRNISERKRVEKLLQHQVTLARLLQTVAVAANQATAVREALQATADAICDAIGWPVGHVYLAEEGAGAPLASTDIWHLAEPDRFAALRAITESLPVTVSSDLPGLVMLSGRPAWVADFTAQPAPPRFGLISDLGVQSGFAFPVLVGAEVAAIFEFFAPAPQAPDAALLDMMANVGAQLGRVIERERSVQALRASEQMYRTLARNLPNGSVLLYDHQLRYTIAEGDALSAAGLSHAMVEGHALDEVLAPARAAMLAPLYEAALRGEHRDIEIESGERFYHSHFLPVQDAQGEVLAGMVMSYDITELKLVERALREERALLARRVEERTADLSLANAELARAARLKDEFLANMSHELRTPLNSILGRVELLQEELHGPITARQAETLRGIEESGHHLLSLISDILDLSKVEAGRLALDIEPVDVGLICYTSMRMVTQQATLKRIRLQSNLDSSVELVHADERRLKQILVNLLSNAVKFTPAGGQVGLEVQGDPEQQTLTFTVWDTGIGIDPAHLPMLFQPFVQIDSSLSRQYSGTGLGLALVLRLTEAHCGSVAVESTPGQGSHFRITLPWQPEELPRLPGAPDPADESGAAARPPVIRRVLIVEDSPTTSSQITRYLHELGIEVESHVQGDQVVARAALFQPDLIILDILLPDASGWEVLRALKAEPRTQAIPVVVVTVVDDPARASALGAAAFLLKPINRATLGATLQQVGRGQLALPAAAAPAPEDQPHVLLAEDNQANIDVLEDYLRIKGYRVTVARNGTEAMMAALETPMDVILMDVQMPGMDGLEATRRLRTHAETRDVPIIALTALTMPGDRERCLAAGATVYLAKPLNLRTLLATIEAQLERDSV